MLQYYQVECKKETKRIWKFLVEIFNFSIDKCHDFFYDKIVTTNKGKYIFLIGKNIDEKIQYSEVELEFNKYKIKIPPQEYFMVNCKINGDTQTNLIDLNKIKYFDENGKDISDTYYWGYKYF